MIRLWLWSIIDEGELLFVYIFVNVCGSLLVYLMLMMCCL